MLTGLLLPLFYINVKDSHDWGDDFAQYFIQARNIVEHRPQTDNGLVFDKQAGEYALQAYPVGFPLILASAWWCFGDSILVSSLALSFFFFAFGIAAFFYFRKYFTESISVLLALVIIYNPLTIGFKKEILSDIPFSFFFLWGVLLFQSERKKTAHFLFTGIVWGFALSVRGIGASLMLALALFTAAAMVRYFLKKEKAELLFSLKKCLLIMVAALGTYLFLNAVLFPVPSSNILRFYADAIRGENFWKWMQLNLDYYYQVFLNFFATMGGSYEWISTGTKYLLIALLPLGLALVWIRKSMYDDWLCISYLLVLFVYPYLGGGFRFLLPVMPVLMKYIFTAFNAIAVRVHLKPTLLATIFLLIVLLQYTPGIINQVKSMDLAEEGPQELPAMEAFQYIKRLPDSAVVVFLKPRALSFYSGKRVAYVMRNVQPDQLPELFARMNAHYFLLSNRNEEVNDVILQKFIADHRDRLKLLWHNVNFNLYSDL